MSGIFFIYFGARFCDILTASVILAVFRIGMFYGVLCAVKPAFHDADTDIHRNNSRKSCMSDVSARILARMSVSWNAGFIEYIVIYEKNVPPKKFFFKR